MRTRQGCEAEWRASQPQVSSHEHLLWQVRSVMLSRGDHVNERSNGRKFCDLSSAEMQNQEDALSVSG